VNDISVDRYGDFIASCSDDGKVCLRSLYSNEYQEMSFDRPVKAVAIDPEYSKSKKRQFVIGGLAGELVLNEKGWFGNNTKKVVSLKAPLPGCLAHTFPAAAAACLPVRQPGRPARNW